MPVDVDIKTSGILILVFHLPVRSLHGLERILNVANK